MKFTINRVVLVVLMAFAFWFFWVVEPAENLEHRYVLSFRNLFISFSIRLVGLYMPFTI